MRKLAAVALAAALLLAAPADARWTRLPDLSPAGAVSSASVAVDARGAGVAVWSLEDEASPITRVVSAARPAGGRFGAPIEVPGSNGLFPRVALAPGGEAFAVWETLVDRGENTGRRLDGAFRPPGGAFGAAAPVTASADFDELGAVAYDEDGTLYLTHHGDRTELLIRRPGAAFVAEAHPGLGAIELDRTGRMTFLVTLPGPAIGVRTRAASGELAPARRLAGYTCTDDPEEPTCAFGGAAVAASRSGRGLVAWCVPSGRYLALRYATRAPGDTSFGPARSLRSVSGHCGPEAELGRAADGVLTWVSRGQLRAVRFTRSGRPSPVRELGPVVSGTVQAAVSPRGDIVLAWNAPGQRLRVATRTFGHAIGPPVTLASDLRDGPAVGIDAAGRALVAYVGGGTGAGGRRTRALAWRP
jgi:hypothetical protein